MTARKSTAAATKKAPSQKKPAAATPRGAEARARAAAEARVRIGVRVVVIEPGAERLEIEEAAATLLAASIKHFYETAPMSAESLPPAMLEAAALGAPGSMRAAAKQIIAPWRARSDMSQHVLEHGLTAVLDAVLDLLDPGADLPGGTNALALTGGLVSARVRKAILHEAFEQAAWNATRAAKLLGASGPASVLRLAKDLGLGPELDAARRNGLLSPGSGRRKKPNHDALRKR